MTLSADEENRLREMAQKSNESLSTGLTSDRKINLTIGQLVVILGVMLSGVGSLIGGTLWVAGLARDFKETEQTHYTELSTKLENHYTELNSKLASEVITPDDYNMAVYIAGQREKATGKWTMPYSTEIKLSRP